MPSAIKKLLKVLGIIIGVIVLVWLGIAAYISSHKKQLLEIVTSQLNDNMTGTLTIEDLEPAIIEGFPGISLSLKNVMLRDSLYESHHRTLLQTKDFFVEINSFSLLSGNPQIQTIRIDNGKIFLFTDSSGYSNSTLFKVDTNANHKNVSKRKIDEIIFNNLHFVYENKLKGKYFDFSIDKLHSRFRHKPNSWDAEMELNMLVNSLTFKPEKGSFLKNDKLNTRLKMHYDRKKHLLAIPIQPLKINKNNMLIGGSFRFADHNSNFRLTVKSPSIEYRNAYSMLFPRAVNRLKNYDLKKPIAIEANLWGRLKGRNIPLVKVNWSTSNNTLRFSEETIENCSFKGYYTNEVVKGKLRKDPNSAVSFKNFRGRWMGINFAADTINISNLKTPVFQGRFKSTFSLAKINAISGSESFRINKGWATLNLNYKAPFNPNDPVEPFIYGNIAIHNAELNYRPRALLFRKLNGAIRLNGQHLSIENMQFLTNSSSLSLNGKVNNFVNFYYNDPKKILLDWNLSSKQINLVEFLSLLSPRKSYSARVGSRMRFFRQLETVLEEANINLALSADRLIYKKFSAQNLNSKIYMRRSGLDLQNVSLNHADGQMQLSGNIDQSGNLNKMRINSIVSNVNVQKLFYSFGNFGQDAITSENIRGILSSNTRISGMMKENGQIVPRSFHGTVSFDLRQGSLVSFEPLQKVGNFAFPNRDFSNIKFRRLQNTLRISGNKIIIPEMTIQSSVLNFFVKGVYGIPTGTNIALKVPIRNPERDKNLPDSLKEQRIRRGIVLNFTAVDDEATGKVKIKFGKREDKVPKNKKTAEPDKVKKEDQTEAVE